MVFLDVSIRVALAVTFLLAAVSKVYRIKAWRSFRGVLGRIVPMPRIITTAIGVMVVTTEFAVASMLLLPHAATFGLAGCILLLVVFSGVITRAVRRKDRIPCRCFGSSAEPMTVAHLHRNIVLSLAAVSGLAISFADTRAPDAETLVVGVLAGISWALVLMFLSELHSFLRPHSFARKADGR